MAFLYTLCFWALSACVQMPKNKSTVSELPEGRKVQVASLGLTLILKEKSTGSPIAAIYNKKGEYFPEIQDKLNQQFQHFNPAGLKILNIKTLPESDVYRESREAYLTFVIDSQTYDGLNKKQVPTKYLLPIERLYRSFRGEKTKGLGYWNTTDLRPLQAHQTLPF